MGAFDTIPSRDPEAMADLAAAALEQEPDDWRLEHVAAHLAAEHPQIAGSRTWLEDNPFGTHELDHRLWNHDHTHPTLARASQFAEVNPSFALPLRPGDPYRHRLAHAWEAELAARQRVEGAQVEENTGTTAKRTRAVSDRAQAAEAERFADLNPDFGVLPDDRDPHQHRFAADREQALALGTRTAETLRAHSHPDPDRRRQAVARIAVEAKLRAAGYEPLTREEARQAAELTGTRPAPQRPTLEQARSDPER